MDKAKTTKTKTTVLKQVKSDTKPHINSFSKFILTILIIISILLTLCVVYANLSQNDTIATKALPTLPFNKHIGFCVVNKDIPNTDYYRGSMLIVKKLNEYSVGDKVLFKNTQSTYKKHAINDMYLIGTVLSTDAENILVNINGIDDKQFKIVNSILIGKATICIDNLGSIYNSMLGIKGYVLYCAIPFLTILLIFFIMRLFVVSRFRSEKVLTEIDGIQKRVVSDDNAESKTPLADITIETVNSTAKPIVQESVELETNSERADKPNSETVRIYTPTISRNNINSNHTPDNIKANDISSPTIEFKAPTEAIVNPELPLISDLSNDAVKPKTVLPTHSVDDIKSVSSIQAVSTDMEHTHTTNQDLAYINKKKPIQPLKADDIINLYRQGKKKIVLDNPEMKNYEEIAKMYYDNDINNY